MNEPKPRRRWWRRKRYVATGLFLLSLAAAVPLSVGGLRYGLAREWVSPPTYLAVANPVSRMVGWTPLAETYQRYIDACHIAGLRAAGDRVEEVRQPDGTVMYRFSPGPAGEL